MLVEKRKMAGWTVTLAIPETAEEWAARGYDAEQVNALAQSAFVVALGQKARDAEIKTQSQADDFAASFTRSGQVDFTSLAFAADWDVQQLEDLIDALRSQGKSLTDVPDVVVEDTVMRWDVFQQAWYAVKAEQSDDGS